MTGGEYYRKTVEAVRGKGNYFKATRLDGSSFADPTFAYVIGETATAKGNGNQLYARGLLHFADTPSETLTGGSWPCRLFEATSSAILASDEHKHGAKSLTVVRELPAWIALGPNGRAVVAFIDLLPTLDAAARDAAASAAMVIVVADLITPEQFATLYAPFAEVLPIENVREHGCKMWPMEGIR